MLIDFFLVIFFLVIIPYSVGTLVLGNQFKIGAKIIVGIIVISFLVGMLHACGVKQQVSQSFLLLLVVTSLYRFVYLQVKNPINIHIHKLRYIKLADVIFHLSLLIILIHGWLLVLTVPISAWDAVAIWYQKAVAYNYWTPIKDIPTVNYPNLFPIFWSLLLGWFNNQEGFGRLVFPLIYFLFFNELYLILRTKRNIDYLISAIILYFASAFFGDWVYNGYQDQVIFSIAGIAMLYGIKAYSLQTCFKQMESNQSEQVKYLFLIAILLGSLGFIKNEGVIISIILTPLPLYLFLKSKLLRSVNFYILPSLYLILLFFWPLALLYNNIDPSNIQGDAFNLNSASAIFSRFDRVPIILSYYKSYFNQNILIILASLFSTLLILAKSMNNAKLVMLLWASLLIHVLFVMSVFLLTNQDLAWHLDTAFSRIMSQHLSLYLIIILILFLPDHSKISDFQSAR